MESAISVKAARLAKQITRQEREAAEKKIENLTQQLESRNDDIAKLKVARDEALAKQEKAHQAEVKKLRTTVRAEVSAEATRTAEAKVERRVQQQEKLIKSLKEQNDVAQRRIEHLTADERGELNEEELMARLRAEFPQDRIERQGRGRAGSDILHEVRYSVGDRAEVAGLVVYECKDTLQWANDFVGQAKKARVTHRTPHVVIVSRKFRRNEEELCVREDVPIVAPARLVDLARVLRGMVIELHRAGLTNEGQVAKTQELYEYLSGDEFRRAFDALLEAATELGDMLDKERGTHERIWAKRQQIYKEIGGKAAAIDGRVRAIIERSDGRKAEVVPLAMDSAL